MPEKDKTTVLPSKVVGQLYKKVRFAFSAFVNSYSFRRNISVINLLKGSRGLKIIRLRDCKIDSGKLVYYISKAHLDANKHGKFIDLSNAEVSSIGDKEGKFWIRIQMKNKKFREVAAKSKYEQDMWIVALTKAACAEKKKEEKKDEKKDEIKDDRKKTEAVKEKKPEKKEEAKDDSSDKDSKKNWEKTGVNLDSHHKSTLRI